MGENTPTEVIDSCDSIYENYGVEEDIMCSSCSLSDMSTTDSDGEYSPDRVIQVKVVSSGDSRQRAVRDPDVSELFTQLRCDYEGKIYPPSMDKYAAGKIHQIHNSFGRNCFIYAAKSLYVSLNLMSNRIRVPKSVQFDVCIFSLERPVTILSFVDHIPKQNKCELYNTLVSRGVTEIFRRSISDDISVVSGVVKENSDLDQRLPDIIHESTEFVLKGSLEMDKTKYQEVVNAFLKAVAISRAYPLIKSMKVDYEQLWFLTNEEFQFITNAVDGTGDSISSDHLLLKVELGLRISKRGKTLLLLPKVELDNIDLTTLRRGFPKLHVHETETYKGSTSFSSIISSSAINEKNTISKKRTLWIISSPKSETLHEVEKSLKMKSKKKKKKFEKCGRSTAVKPSAFRPSPQWQQIWKQRTRRVTKSLTVEFLLYLLTSLTLYDEEKPSSIVFCFLKCLPVLYLIKCVLDQSGKNTFKRQYMYLLSGLSLSLTGDVLLVWKNIFFDLGIFCAALSHLLYAHCFDWKPFNYLMGLILLIGALTSFLTFKTRIDMTGHHVVYFYIVSVSVMSWRALAKCLTPCDYKSDFTMVKVLCPLFFIISSVSTGIEWFINPFPISHILSMVTYYLGQLCMTLSVLKDSAVVTELNFLRCVFYVIIGGLLEVNIEEIKYRPSPFEMPYNNILYISVITCSVIRGFNPVVLIVGLRIYILMVKHPDVFE